MLKIPIYMVATVYMVATAVCLCALLVPVPTRADGFNPMNVLNPGKWLGKRGDGYGSDDEPPPPPPPPPPPEYGMPYYAPPPINPGFGGWPGYANPIAPPYANYPSTVMPSNFGYGMAPANIPAPQTSGYTSSSKEATDGPSREEMAHHIKELEERLEVMERKSQQPIAISKPAASPLATYEYYSGEHSSEQNTKYPFRPLNRDY